MTISERSRGRYSKCINLQQILGLLSNRVHYSFEQEVVLSYCKLDEISIQHECFALNKYLPGGVPTPLT